MAFERHRDLLFGVAYRILGRVADAEDVLQEAWLRWSKVADEEIGDPEAYLVTVTTRLAVDRLRRIRARRETYPGPWLPEPVLTGDLADDVVRAESVSMALLVVLETLSPVERAVFVLHDVFEVPYGEVAAVLGKSEPAVRKLASRARAHVRERRRRFDADAATWRAVTDRFIDACLHGGIEGLMELLAPDVELIADGGGRALAPRRAVAGAEKVARFVLKVMAVQPAFRRSAGLAPATKIGFALVTANGGPAIVLSAERRPIALFQVTARDGKIGTCYMLVNPDKFAGLVSQEAGVPRP
ncbi:RNA polymerase sigma factor SigJ [Bailinhaonella thermotolerans]|uniref:Sigma-70 family RNA polymerase sigma factor n=1 Tax=Bailinhaonella thermotolerans TaxID=1070861 RepID=A0A3A4A574_9ACTN|nr:RNA polymerase sigma factor SigJ [Bailinhaonella thermotolerans]RJL22939.1 sigma-70 family RNA polymerase sigma factor [Bailinhaonella thermotolerans]